MGLLSGLLGHGSAIDPAELSKLLDGILLPGESAEQAFRIIRDCFIFTDRRVILVDVQGITGSKKEHMSIPYRAITRFSVESTGSFDMEAELKIWVSGSATPIEKTLKKGTNVRAIQRCLAAGVCR